MNSRDDEKAKQAVWKALAMLPQMYQSARWEHFKQTLRDQGFMVAAIDVAIADKPNRLIPLSGWHFKALAAMHEWSLHDDGKGRAYDRHAKSMVALCSHGLVAIDFARSIGGSPCWVLTNDGKARAKAIAESTQ